MRTHLVWHPVWRAYKQSAPLTCHLFWPPHSCLTLYGHVFLLHQVTVKIQSLHQWFSSGGSRPDNGLQVCSDWVVDSKEKHAKFSKWSKSPFSKVPWGDLRFQLKQTRAKACRKIEFWARLTKLPPIILSLSPNDEQFRLHCNQRSGREWQLAANWSRCVRKGPLRLSSNCDGIFTEAQTARQNDSSLYHISVLVRTVRCISLDLAKNCHLNG